MMKKSIISFFCLLWVLNAIVYSKEPYREKLNQEEISWDNSLSLPERDGKLSLGFAGSFSGFIGERLVIAGGANFPDNPPWKEGKKRWWQTLYYKDVSDEHARWRVYDDALPHPLGYGITIQLPEGLLCIGGCDEQQCYADVFLISIENGRPVVCNNWPSLPVPLANATGALLGNSIYVAGGQESMKKQEATTHFYRLDLDNLEKGWQTLATWPGAPRGYAVSVAQHNGYDLCFYLFSGRNYKADGWVEVLKDGYMYIPRLDRWEPVRGEFPVMAGTAIAVGTDEICFLGGVPLLLPTSEDHPGFDNTVRTYNVAKQAFVKEEMAPFDIPVTTTVAKKDNVFYICSGEVKPGIRTPKLLRGEYRSVK